MSLWFTNLSVMRIISLDSSLRKREKANEKKIKMEKKIQTTKRIKFQAILRRTSALTGSEFQKTSHDYTINLFFRRYNSSKLL